MSVGQLENSQRLRKGVETNSQTPVARLLIRLKNNFFFNPNQSFTLFSSNIIQINSPLPSEKTITKKSPPIFASAQLPQPVAAQGQQQRHSRSAALEPLLGVRPAGARFWGHLRNKEQPILVQVNSSKQIITGNVYRN